MKVQGKGKPYDDINITPMLDLAYVLLVIFIIMTTASVQGVKVNLPKASDTPSLAKPKTVAITVTNDGKIYINAIPVTLVELEDKLRQQQALDPDFPVVVKGDSEVQYKNVMDVIALMSRLNITQLGLATSRLVNQ